MSYFPSDDAIRLHIQRATNHRTDALTSAYMWYYLGPLAEKHWRNKHLKIATVQRWAQKMKINPGPIDGIMGPKTRAALMLMEARLHGLKATPEPGDAMGRVSASFLPWLDRAESLMGVTEIRGRKHSPVIMGWARDQKIWYPSDETPWCGLFVAHCMAVGNWEQPDNPLGARKWLGFGQDVTPQLGAILVFWRGSPKGWKGHVGFYVGEDSKAYHVLGGNQRDAVNVKRIAKKRLLDAGARWPSGVEQEGIVRRLDARGRLSTDEA